MWFTGLSGSGKSTIAFTLEHALVQRGQLAYVLDGDNIRHGLNKNLGFSAADREENIRRIGEVAKLFADCGVHHHDQLHQPLSQGPRHRPRPARRGQAAVHRGLSSTRPIATCEQRDPKGLYKKARAGQLKNFTGIDDPYEAPLKPELTHRRHQYLAAAGDGVAARIPRKAGGSLRAARESDTSGQVGPLRA